MSHKNGDDGWKMDISDKGEEITEKSGNNGRKWKSLMEEEVTH